MGLPPELLSDLRMAINGEIRDDVTTRLLYSTDASIYQIEPLGVAFPRTLDDLAATVEMSARYKVPVLARGAGSSLAGQAVGEALILDCSRYLTKILEINPEEDTATVEPGVLLTTLNQAAGKYGLTFGPDPASADRATMGGCVANNATGSHSILYGMTVDHVLAVDVVLADGSLATFNSIPLDEARNKKNGCQLIESAIYRTALNIHDKHEATIQAKWPLVWRRASSYNLNYLLPWSPSTPPRWQDFNRRNTQEALPYPPVEPGHINLAPLIVGSEGTLAVIRRVKVRLVPKIKHTSMAVLTFDSIAEACDAAPELLNLEPSAIELIPREMIILAKSVPAYASKLSFIEGEPAPLLAVEFAGNDPGYVQEKAYQLKAYKKPAGCTRILVIESPEQQKHVTDVRKAGLGLLMSIPGDLKPEDFIEDVAVPVERLGQYVREVEQILVSYNTRANFYAHASAGCLHIRVFLNLKTKTDVDALHSIASQVVDLALSLGGTVSGEHGGGIARSEWVGREYGSQIVSLFRDLKTAADPNGILNPGKILDSDPMNTHLRFGPDYQAQGWQPFLDFSRQDGLLGAIEMCNGAGVCRKPDGVMCPSFQVTQEEMYSTRGRANLLRSMLTQKGGLRFPRQEMAQQAVYQALDLCLACKGCKAECPSAVDIAKLKYEFLNYYYGGKRLPRNLFGSHRRRMRDYLFGYIGLLAPLGAALAPFANTILANRVIRRLNESFLGLTSRRQFPQFNRISKWNSISALRGFEPQQGQKYKQIDCLFLTDTFSHYFHPETEVCARGALEAAGLRIQVLPIIGAGRTLISKGFLEDARKHASRLVEAIYEVDPQGRLPVIGVEPSEIYTLRDEFLDFFPGEERVMALAGRAWMIDEFLLRPNSEGELRIATIVNSNRMTSLNHNIIVKLNKPNKRVLLHGHCYQKAQPPAMDGYPNGVAATVAMLKAAGFQVEVIDSGCCGMAGAFGYEADHYDISMKLGEMTLFPAVRQAETDVIITAVGTSCRSHIKDGTQRNVVHPITLIMDSKKLEVGEDFA
jgi:FAD/FMN-containing dehydrogenase/Fe-S oxidoreductase